jgi:hypothetical protein
MGFGLRRGAEEYSLDAALDADAGAKRVGFFHRRRKLPLNLPRRSTQAVRRSKKRVNRERPTDCFLSIEVVSDFH